MLFLIFKFIILLFLFRFIFNFFFGGRSSTSSSQGGGAYSMDFEEALLRVLAAAMKADGRVTRSELDVVKQVLVAQFGETNARTALLRLRDILKTDFDIRVAAMNIGSMVSYSDRVRIAEILCDIAEADGIITDSEVQTIVNMSYYMGLSSSDTNRIASRLHVNGGDRSYHRSSYGGSTSSASDLSQAYATLGLDSSATNEQLKTAYRNLVKKYHPDRFATQSQEEQDKAAEMFKKVQDAYEKIKDARGV